MKQDVLSATHPYRSTARTGIALLVAACGGAAHADGPGTHAKSATAITQVFGDGQKLTAVALEYDRAIDGTKLSPASFHVEGRTVLRVSTSVTTAPAPTAASGPYVIVELSPDDPAASLREGGPGPGEPGGSGKGPGGNDQQGGSIKGPPHFSPRQVFKPASATVVQTGPVTTVDGQTYPPSTTPIATGAVVTPVVDDFRQFAYQDSKTGGVLKYNLFIPKDYDPTRSYPLVLFIHDAGVLSDDATTTLKQGLGAVAFASPDDQARHPAFVLAPQFADVTVTDQSQASQDLDTTVDLVGDVASRFNVDKNRLYATGQSMGAMMSIAMNIKYPDLFAATFIVAGQRDPEKVAPLARQKLWIVVSQGDLKAYPGQNAITATLEKQGAKVSRAVWNGGASPEDFATAVRGMDARGAQINYVALEKGTVVPPGQRDDGGGNHVNTWRIAYGIPGIRDWLFAQRKAPDGLSATQEKP